MLLTNDNARIRPRSHQHLGLEPNTFPAIEIRDPFIVQSGHMIHGRSLWCSPPTTNCASIEGQPRFRPLRSATTIDVTQFYKLGVSKWGPTHTNHLPLSHKMPVKVDVTSNLKATQSFAHRVWGPTLQRHIASNHIYNYFNFLNLETHRMRESTPLGKLWYHNVLKLLS
jgi:hypothetical protein